MENKSKGKKGFTLIEMLIVVAIIGLLAMIVLFAVARARRKSVAAKMMADMESVMKGVEMAASDGCSEITIDFGEGDNPLACDPDGTGPIGEQVYIKRIPKTPSMCGSCNYEVTDAGGGGAAISTSSYILTATGFVDSDEFECSEGSCYCNNSSSGIGSCLAVE